MKAKQLIAAIFFFCGNSPLFAQQTVSADKDWHEQHVFLKNTPDADIIIREGDVDNLGFGWPEGFDPFCGRMTASHGYPWEAKAEDLPGFDRILLSASYSPKKAQPCSGDGYSGSYDPVTSKPVVFNIPTLLVGAVTIKNAYLQIFIDDFQAPSMCSKFQVTLNNKRFTEAEKFINAIDQTGPVGKLISIPVPEEFYDDIIGNASFSLYINDVKGSADGFAIDFIRLLINRKQENACKGNISGRVLLKNSETPVAGARVYLSNNSAVEADKDGRFTMNDIATGFEIISASAAGYNDGHAMADIGQGDENAEVLIYLEKGKQVIFNQKNLKVGEAISLKNILFDQGQSVLKAPSKPELDKLVALLNSNANAEIELSGHTSSEGEAAYNRSLSYRRVKACKEYIVAKGIDASRINITGYGPDRPVASNSNEAGRILNRRVELRLIKL